MGFGVWGLGFGVWGLGFRVWFCVAPVVESRIRLLPRDAVTEIQTGTLWCMCEVVKGFRV